MKKGKIKIIKKGNKIVEPLVLENVEKSEKTNVRKMAGAVSDWVSERRANKDLEEVSAMKIISGWKQISDLKTV